MSSVYMVEKAKAQLREQKISTLQSILDGSGYDEDILDDLVHDLFSQQASDVNNLGPAEQMGFILDTLGDQDGEKEIRIILNAPKV